jgi:lysyl-tRNA synthetase class 2
MGDDHYGQMNFVEALVQMSFAQSAEWRRSSNVDVNQSFERLEYDEAFARHAGRTVLDCSTGELPKIAAARNLTPPVYPASQAALARTVPLRPGAIETAERFELYINGVELCNGYHELTDPAALRQRMFDQAALRASAGLRPRFPRWSMGCPPVAELRWAGTGW